MSSSDRSVSSAIHSAVKEFLSARQLAATSDVSGISLQTQKSHFEITLQRILHYKNKVGSGEAVSRKSKTRKPCKSNSDFPWFCFQPVFFLCYCLAVCTDQQMIVDICHRFRIEESINESDWKICFATPVLVGFEEKLKNSHLLIQELAVVFKTFDSTLPLTETHFRPDVSLSQNPYKSYVIYIKAHSLYIKNMFEAVLQLFQEEDTTYYTDAQSVLFLNLKACCYFKLGNCWSAVENFQAALKLDFSFLVPLYNIAVVYQQQKHVQAELDTLKYLITALNSTTSIQYNIVHLGEDNQLKLSRYLDMYGAPLRLPYIMYLICKRCLQENYLDEASEHYLDLLGYFRDNHFLQHSETYMLSCPLPSITEIHLEAAFCMLKAGKYDECIIICDWLLSCVNGDNSRDYLHASSMMFSQLNRSDEEEDYFLPGSSQFSKDRNCSMTSFGNSPGQDIGTNNSLSHLATTLLALLYKADSLVHIDQLDDALQTLQLATQTVQENPHLLSKVLPLQQPSEKCQKGDDDSSAIPFLGDATDPQAPFLSVVQAVYNNTAVLLQSRHRYQDAVHCFRLGLQISPKDLLLSFNCVLTLICLKQFESGADLWTTYREMKGSKTALHKLLKSKRTQLESFKNQKESLKSTPKCTDEPSLFVVLQLDIAILENVLRTREKAL
ncbi:uncharacterized protein LOC106879875 isoform X2 [Octopus bimaculoides]|uniref:Uncharacterized protein n=1 Tax=Octopus bimaculoides TaxID=37653 RepID=A0A0L8G0W1_OCTBM|nr:uncharacterized protein LOC106879875 isoform X2 [Octopus bimaculoides]|eukprot:XP_014785086.1 PREDICTED: uncharacterized protein LOC106879875 isoform X2 [Octopus bimaculoides]